MQSILFLSLEFGWVRVNGFETLSSILPYVISSQYGWLACMNIINVNVFNLVFIFLAQDD
jgi:hypothetical protein